jgi:hypothetical protein
VWTAIRKEWDYFALTCLLGLYVTAAVAAIITSVMALTQTF